MFAPPLEIRAEIRSAQGAGQPAAWLEQGPAQPGGTAPLPFQGDRDPALLATRPAENDRCENALLKLPRSGPAGISQLSARLVQPRRERIIAWFSQQQDHGPGADGVKDRSG